jgi:hypothetical protein
MEVGVVNPVANEAAGIRVELDVDRLGAQIAQLVAQHLTCLFPDSPAEFWAALCEQASRERQRVAAMLDLTCTHREGCPYGSRILAGVRLEGVPDESSGSDAKRSRE